jgi:hypothetical protein
MQIDNCYSIKFIRLDVIFHITGGMIADAFSRYDSAADFAAA